MSHFIAHTLTFSKDRTTFRLKGGDNNVVPRSNEWTKEIPSSALLWLISSGSVKLTGSKYIPYKKLAMQIDKDFGGTWETKDTFFHLESSQSPRVIEHQNRFLSELFELIDNPKPQTKYIITDGERYIRTATPKSRKASITYSINNAKQYTEDIANTIASRFTGFYIQSI